MTESRPSHPDFKKSAASGATNCVEVASNGGVILVRDSKDPRGPQLTFLPREWMAFLAGVRNGEFDFDFDLDLVAGS